MRDRKSEEVARTLKQYGIYRKLRDMGYKWKGSTQLESGEVERGFPDGFFIGSRRGSLVETKHGEGERDKYRLPFSAWSDAQRAFYLEELAPRGIPLYLFLILGNEIRSVEYPRIALMLRAEDFLLYEKSSSRKSLSYGEASSMDWARLQWAGKSTWTIPQTHDFYRRIILGEE